ncbi:protein ZNF365 [Poecilia reticulata]|uniref:protein ZNF365 n=1 Tax=Poecilia reticulata TaxID=8081 RepID=UPI0007EA7820|nr:PREDICTED: protein ZNF365 [Poecilia reticulata]
MQQKLYSRGSGSFLLERNGQACGALPDSVTSCELPFRCPRCGEQQRFRSLASLRAHLEYRHSYRSPDVVSGDFSITGSLPDPLAAAIAWQDASLPARRGQHGAARPVRSLSDSRDSGYLHSYGAVRRRTQSVGVGTQEEGVDDEDTGEEEEDEEETRDESEVKQSDSGRLPHLPSPPDPDLDPVAQSYCGRETAAASAAVRRRLASILRAADGTMRSLSRQVDVAVMVIAALREQLNASESELERREREVLTIQRFLEAAARQETSGKVRIQRFIENLLGRIALAEKLVEFYQVNGGPAQGERHKTQTDVGRHRVSKSRSAGGQLFSGFHDNRTQSSCRFGGGPPGSKAGPDRDRERQERLAQSSRLFCRPEHRDDIWNQQRRRSTGYEA